MKKVTSVMLFIGLLSTSLKAQSPFQGLGGKKGYYNKLAAKSKKVLIPQLAIGFHTYYEAKETASSKYAGSVSSKATAILDSDIRLEDFQQLANEFQLILEEEMVKEGIQVLTMDEFSKTKNFEKLSKKYTYKAENKQEKNSEDLIGKGKIKMLPKNSVFIFDDKSFTRGGGVPFITFMRNLIKDTDATPVLQNIDINFATLNLDAQLNGGTLTSKSAIQANMSITRNIFDLIGPDGPDNTSAGLASVPYVSTKTYEAKIYREPAKGKNLLKQLFSLSSVAIDFDPFIVEMNKELYMENARALFRQYAKDFAKAYSSTRKQ